MIFVTFLPSCCRLKFPSFPLPNNVLWLKRTAAHLSRRRWPALVGGRGPPWGLLSHEHAFPSGVRLSVASLDPTNSFDSIRAQDRTFPKWSPPSYLPSRARVPAAPQSCQELVWLVPLWSVGPSDGLTLVRLFVFSNAHWWSGCSLFWSACPGFFHVFCGVGFSSLMWRTF